MQKKILSPTCLEIDGKLVYDTSLRSFSTIKMRKEVIKIFGIFERQEKKYCYKMQVITDYDSFKKIIDDIDKDKKSIPILLYLYETEEK